jgi:hypothetical protein
VPLVHADLRQNLGGKRDVDPGQLLFQDFPYATLVRGVAERPKKGHRHRFHALLAKMPCRGTYVLLIERYHHLTVDGDALLDDLDLTPGHQVGRRGIPFELVFFQASPHVQHVTKSLGSQEAGRGPLAGEHGIGGDGGAVDDRVHLTQKRVDRQALISCRLLQPAEKADGRILGSRRRFVNVGSALVLGDQEIGEGPADIDADTITHSSLLLRSYFSCGDFL